LDPTRVLDLILDSLENNIEALVKSHPGEYLIKYLKDLDNIVEIFNKLIDYQNYPENENFSKNISTLIGFKF
jgi:hypothetical protein